MNGDSNKVDNKSIHLTNSNLQKQLIITSKMNYYNQDIIIIYIYNICIQYYIFYKWKVYTHDRTKCRNPTCYIRTTLLSVKYNNYEKLSIKFQNVNQMTLIARQSAKSNID